MDLLRVYLSLLLGIITTIISIDLLLVDSHTHILSSQNNLAYAHFVGTTRTIGDYRIVFQAFPFVPFAGENSTLNFSILDKDNLNVNNVYAALIIKEKNTGRVVKQIPYKFYEFSDITFPYKFQNNSDYIATLESRISGDPKYEARPLIANFDISVGKSPISLPFNELMLYYVTPAVVIPTAILMYLRYNKNKNAVG